MVTISEQIQWVKDQRKYLIDIMPDLIASGRYTPERAEKKIATINATLKSLLIVRDLIYANGEKK